MARCSHHRGIKICFRYSRSSTIISHRAPSFTSAGVLRALANPKFSNKFQLCRENESPKSQPFLPLIRKANSVPKWHRPIYKLWLAALAYRRALDSSILSIRTVRISGDGRTTCKQTRKLTTRPPLHAMVTRRHVFVRGRCVLVSVNAKEFLESQDTRRSGKSKDIRQSKRTAARR